MKKAVIGVLAGAAVGLAAYKMYEKKHPVELNRLKKKAKKSMRNVMHKAEDQIDDIRDMAAHELKKGLSLIHI